MKSWILAALAGVLLGAAGAYGYLGQHYEGKLHAIQEQNDRLSLEASDAKKELSDNQARLKSAERMNQQLAQASPPAATEILTVQEAVAPPPNQDRAAEMRAFGERMLRRGTDRWKDALNLTPDQLNRLTQIQQAKLQNGQQINWGNPAALQADLLQVLTPEQKTEYDHIQARESQARLELRTQTQLSQVQSMFDLTETQKDQIYQKFAVLEQAPAAPANQTQNQGNGNRGQGRQAQNQKRIDALNGILTPQQIQQYQKNLNSNNGFGGTPY